MKHFLNTQDWSRPELDALLAQAEAFKRSPRGRQLEGRTIALVFFNPSLRTRTSFEVGAFHLGGHAVVLAPGKDAWPIEFDYGTVMAGEAEEHISEVARVLSRYVDLIGVRAFPKFRDWQEDREDKVLRGFARLFQETNLFVLYAATGLLVQFGLQALINMGSSLHLIPTKGMTLPFLSYGGSSLLALAFGTGMLLAFTRRRVGRGAA